MELYSTARALTAVIPAITSLKEAMERDCYVSNSMVRNALAKSGNLGSSWSLDSVGLIAPDLEPLRPDLELFAQVSAQDYRAISARNANFISTEIRRYDDFFRSVETSAMSSEQRIAAVVMEDRNLVVAAAGSGKTSVLVAKVGYLAKKGIASPEEILVLSFNASVAAEIQTRIEDRLVKPGVIPAAPAVSTFHALGLKTINDAGDSHRLAPLAQSSELRSREIQRIFLELVRTDTQFRIDALRFLALFGVTGAAHEATDTAAQFGASWRQLISQPVGTVELPDSGSSLYVALSGDTVRSKQELQIANWLTLMGVDFVYEKRFPPVASHPWTRDYRPDFYYPALGLWHEHFGTNVFGKAPMHWGANRVGMTYEQQAASKRGLLEVAGVKWFETTSGDFESGTWEQRLRANLEKAGAKPQLINWERFQNLAASAGGQQPEVLSLFGAAIAHFKSNHLSIGELRTRAQKAMDPDRSHCFVRLFEKVFARYTANLTQAGQIDFDDMLGISTKRLAAKKTPGPYKAILVDEFQDMSNARAEFIKALLHNNPGATLFAVGDDWQSIYRFAGSDISVMTQFEKLFGYTCTVTLGTTYRCNQGLANLSSEFIQKNPNQIRKSVTAVSDQKTGVVQVVFHSGKPDPALVQQLEKMAAWARRRSTPANVCLLGRYRHLEPTNFTALADQFRDDLNLSFSTVHRAKGLSFDFVIVLGMSCNPGSDFPSSRQDDPLLSLFMPIADTLPHAEERRLFYVAMTRARHACVLLAPKFGASSFVAELLQSRHQESVRSLEISQDGESDVPNPLTAAMQQVCPECRRGRLLPRMGPYGPFMVCERKDRGISTCKNINGHIPPGQSTSLKLERPRQLGRGQPFKR